MKIVLKTETGLLLSIIKLFEPMTWRQSDSVK